MDVRIALAQLALTARSVTESAIDLVALLPSKKSLDKKLAAAQIAALGGDADLTAGDFLDAITQYGDAVRAIQSHL